MQIIVHIGAPKTGSTALQRFLSENAGRLAKHGVLYPDVNLRGYGHHDLAFLLYGSYPDWASPQPRTLRDLSDDLRRAALASPAAARLVLSSEDFYLFPAADGLKALLEDVGLSTAGARIVVYIRRQDEAHISWYNQAVKAQGYAGSIEDSLRDHHDLWDYRSRLAPWREAFGSRALSVRLMPRDVRRDFIALLDLPEGAFDYAAASPNGRLNRDILEYQRELNRRDLPVQEKRRFHKALIALTEASAGADVFDDTPVLTRDRRNEIMRLYADSNTEIARAFFGREKLFVREPKFQDAASPWPGLTAEKIAHIAAWIDAHHGRKAG